MDLRICDGEGCNNALDVSDKFSDRARRASVGWIEVTLTRIVPALATSVVPDMPPDPDKIHGEVTIDGKPHPFVIHKPKEVAEREKALDEWRSQTLAVQRTVTLCPKCAPTLRLKPQTQAQGDE